MNRRTALALVLLGVALSVAVPAMANLLAGGKDAGRDVAFDSTNGPNVTVGESINFTTQNPWQEPQQITLEPYGNFSSNGDTHVRVDRWNGTWTNLSQLDVQSATLTVDPNDKPAVIVGGDADALRYRETMGVDDGQVDFVYGGTSGTTTLTIRNLPTGTTIAAIDADNNTALGYAVTDAQGVGTFTLDNSEHDVLLQTSDGDPVLSDPQPEGDQREPPTELSVAVDDPDFPQDTVTVEFYLDGSSVGTDEVDDTGRASITIPEPSRGDHSVRAVATDGYNQTSELTWEFGTPNEITARNVSNPSEVINGQEVTFTFYQQDGNVTQRTTTNGTVTLGGLDTSGDIVVTVEAPGTSTAPSYHTRQFVIQDISDQQNVYMLPDASTAATTLFQEFTLQDQSGNYDPSESRLIIQRGLNISGGVQWKTVAGGAFGAVNEYSTFLEQDTQYRLIVENDAGDQRVVGDYVARNEDNPKIITIKSVIVDRPGSADRWGTAWITDVNESDGNQTLWFQYNDTSGETTDVSVVVHERNNESNVLTRFSGSNFGESFTYSTGLSGDQLNRTWIVDWEAQNASGATVASGEEPVGRTGRIPIPMDPEWLWRFALVAIPVVAALASERIATLGALGTVAFAGILMIAGIAQIPFVLWLAAAVIALGGHAFQMRTEGAAYG